MGMANGDRGQTVGNRASAGGGQMTITGQCGMGREMVSNLQEVKDRYDRVKAIEHRNECRANKGALR